MQLTYNLQLLRTLPASWDLQLCVPTHETLMPSWPLMSSIQQRIEVEF